MPYTFLNQNEKRKALSFWKRHKKLAPRDPATLTALGGTRRRPSNKSETVRFVLVPLYLDNNRPVEDIVGEYAAEKYNLPVRPHPHVSLDVTVYD